MNIEKTLKQLKDFIGKNKIPTEQVIKMAKTFEEYNDEPMIEDLIKTQALAEDKDFLKWLQKDYEGLQGETHIRSSYHLRKLQFDYVEVKSNALEKIEITNDDFFNFDSMKIENLLTFLKIFKTKMATREVEYLDLKRQIINKVSKDEINTLSTLVDKLETAKIEFDAAKTGLGLIEDKVKSRDEDIAKLGYLLG